MSVRVQETVAPGCTLTVHVPTRSVSQQPQRQEPPEISVTVEEDKEAARLSWFLYILGCCTLFAFPPCCFPFWILAASLHYCKPRNLRHLLPQQRIPALIALWTTCGLAFVCIIGLSVFASILISESPEFSMGPMEPPKHMQFRGSFHDPSDIQAPSIMMSESLEHSMEPIEPLDVQFLGSFHGPSHIQPPSIMISESLELNTEPMELPVHVQFLGHSPSDSQPLSIMMSGGLEHSMEPMETPEHVQFFGPFGGPSDDQPPSIIISESPEHSMEAMEPYVLAQFPDVQPPCPGAIEQLRKDAPSGIPLAPPTAPIIRVGNDDPFDALPPSSESMFVRMMDDEDDDVFPFGRMLKNVDNSTESGLNMTS